MPFRTGPLILTASLLLTLFQVDGACAQSVAEGERAAQNAARTKVTFSVQVKDENSVAVAGAQTKVFGMGISVTCSTDFSGTCKFLSFPQGSHTVQVSKPGFYVASVDQFSPKASSTLEITLTHQQEVKESVTVTASQPEIDPQQTSLAHSFNGNDVINIPYPTTRDVRMLLPFIPGVVLDSSNQPHVAGAATYQTLDVLDGFNITDPVSGLLNLRVSTDAVRKIDVEESRYSAEYGKASGGMISLETGMGDDQLRFSATNFIPSVEFKKGLNFDKWVPRATISGPIVPGRAWFFEAPDAEYDTNIVKELPDRADRAPLLRLSNLSKTQVNLGKADIVTASFLFNSFDQHHAGLSTLNLQSTTSNLRQFAYLPSFKEQHSFANGVLAEFGIGWLAVDGHQRPLGSAPFVVRPEGNSGNFFRSSDSAAHRLQGLFNLYLPAFEARGRHELKLGVDLDRLTYDQSVRRTPISVVIENGLLTEQVTFPGPATFTKNNFESSAYVQDRWSVTDRLLVEAGLRLDRDSIIRDVAVGPRFASTYSPRDGTKFSFGAGLYYDQTNLELVSRPLQGPRVENFYAADGSTITRTREVVFDANTASLKLPRYLNWSLGIEQRLPRQNYFRAEFLQRRGSQGLAYLNESSATAPILHLGLQSTKQDHYDAVQASLRHTFKGEHVLFASYTRSAARSNAVLDFTLDQVFDPLFAQQNNGPLPWDTPNRLLSYGWLPLPKVEFSYTLEWRTGFAYSWVNQQQQIVGAPNSHRFPNYFDFGPYIEKRFPFLGVNWAVRGGFDNITGHRNPSVVNNNVNSPQFLQFTQFSGRTFTARIRFLGRK